MTQQVVSLLRKLRAVKLHYVCRLDGFRGSGVASVTSFTEPHPLITAPQAVYTLLEQRPKTAPVQLNQSRCLLGPRLQNVRNEVTDHGTISSPLGPTEVDFYKGGNALLKMLPEGRSLNIGASQPKLHHQ
jgi:hypothetical protein